MKRKLPTIYAALCTALMLGGFALAFYGAWQAGIPEMVSCLIGCVAAFAFAPLAHEGGHLLFAKTQGMRLVLFKAFCIRVRKEKGRNRFSFASPFSADQTQVLPQKGGDMRRRASVYAAGGLLLGGAFALAICAVALWTDSYLAWGALPYAAYLVILNLAPLQYPSGKTDTLVLRGIRKGYAEEKTMLSAMEIQEQLAEGKTYGEIDKELYFDQPQLCEDEPLYALSLQLRYYYFLDREEYEGAADCLNRLIASQAYLADGEAERLAAELVYLHSLRGDVASAEESGKHCREFLESGDILAKRALIAFSKAAGKEEALPALFEQAERALQAEWIVGVKKTEEKLLARIKTGTNGNN